MHKTVIKIGGSNLKDQENIGRIIPLLKGYNEPVLLIVSAFYRITDKLASALEHRELQASLPDELYQLHQQTIDRFITNNKEKQRAEKQLQKTIDRLKKLFSGFRTEDAATANAIMSYGERLSALTLQAVLNANGIHCRLALPEEVGIVSNRRFFQGSVLLKKTEENLKKFLHPEMTYVIPGFYAVSREGETVLLGRGGSDYSAACIARCVGAKYLDVWKDVEGYLSGDPKIITGVRRIPHLSYLEAAELSYFGAKILHPRTIRPLVSQKTEIRILNPDKYLQTQKREALTRISHQKSTDSEIIKSVTANEDIALLKLKGSGVGIKKGILAMVTGAFDQARINIRSVVTSQTAIHFIFSRADAQKAKKIVDELNTSLDFDTEIEDNIAWVAAVGNGINQKEGIAGRMFTALAKAGINVQQIVLGASEVAVYFVIQRKLADKAAQIIHHELFHKTKTE